MSLLDWNFSISTGSGTAPTQSLDITSDAIEDGSSLLCLAPPTGTPPTDTMMAAGWGGGVTSDTGMVRHAFRFKGTGGSPSDFYGVYCLMQTALSTTNDCYMGVWDNSQSALRICRGNLRQILNRTYLILAHVGITPLIEGAVVGIQLNWQLDQTTGGMFLGLSTVAIASPSTYDWDTYPGMTLQLLTTDNPPLTSGVNAGPWIAGGGGGFPPTVKIGIGDVTQIYIP